MSPPHQTNIPTIAIHPISFDHPTALPLHTAQQQELTAQGVSYVDAAPLTAADIPIFFLAYADGIPVGCGGLRPVFSSEGLQVSGTAEVKRMFVVPEYRGLVLGIESYVGCEDEGGVEERKGASVAELLLRRLESVALEGGTGRLVLATAACLVGANRFYTRCGFVPCEVFGTYGVEDESLYYEKRLLGCGVGVSGQLASGRGA